MRYLTLYQIFNLRILFQIVNYNYLYDYQQSLMYKNKKPQIKQRFADTEILQKRIEEETPKSGQYFYDYKLAQAKKQEGILDQQEFHMKYKINFTDLPISEITSRGLSNRSFKKMTEIQRCVIPHALGGRDIMAASRTGSGKTLAYLVPLVEKLYRQRFIAMDGLGAIVLVPVRELAMQVFQVLNSFTSQMELSVGLVIGGKNVDYQKARIAEMNILICTPGRLLQHLEETYGFETNNLKMLVLDEADVMMQMGFRNTLNEILKNLPKTQTLLFSATLSKSIEALATLSLNQPERVFLNSTSNTGQNQKINKVQEIGYYQTPAKLMQYYMIVKTEDKLNTLYSFLKSHPKQKILIFVSTCKQARFIYESFKKFRLGCPLYEIQGHQKQKKRMAIYFTFCEKRYGILISTNISSRGLDFPMIDWVVQLDLPEDVETYVHRVGRTARYRSQGKALTFVADHQKQFVNQLKQLKINIHKITQNPQRYFTIQSSLQSICSQHQDIKYLAQRALVSYLKFIHKTSNKKIFRLQDINSQKLALSYGLMNAPIITIKNNTEEGEDQGEADNGMKKQSKIQKLRMKAKLKKQLKSQKIQQKQKLKKESSQQQQEVENNQLFKTKQIIKAQENDKPILTSSKRQMKKIKNEGHFDGKNKVFFDQNLIPIPDDQYRRRQYIANNKQQSQLEYDMVQQMQNRILQHKQEDDEVQLQRRKNRRRKIKMQKENSDKGNKSKPKYALLQSQQEQENIEE